MVYYFVFCCLLLLFSFYPRKVSVCRGFPFLQDVRASRRRTNNHLLFRKTFAYVADGTHFHFFLLFFSNDSIQNTLLYAIKQAREKGSIAF